ncbi:virulence-associated E family protein [Pseudoduganella sp. DS3]|uniref:Virulence-associated E family protein n=1 Tax=Pseudoduganella guangdongensis TaxID=2692179 RepID=A0A6N9HMH7_9BURK|nr:VapE domain-containing protein [Pseudoduganella guangdongensis]MYN04393.1 virulence-associated E family protein [Pseudoduganella guangdongensis]
MRTPEDVNNATCAIAVSPANAIDLDHAKRLEFSSFPNLPNSGGNPPCTIPNIKHLLDSYQIRVRYNLISKRVEINLPGHSRLGSADNAENVSSSQIVSLAALNGINTARVSEFVYTIADRNQYNPAKDWIESKPWDNTDRLEEFYGTLTVREGYPLVLKKALMKKWILSAVASVLTPNNFRTRGVLTLQGPQSIGKTSWIRRLVDGEGSENLVKLDQHIDAHNKDTLLTAIAHWIVEIGELDSSFKKDIGSLKGFLTRPEDKLRRPYAKEDSSYPRRTVFCASVNDDNFLVDNTGNSRWWTIPVIEIKYDHSIDMQQVFAQLAVECKAGATWWLTPEEEEMLGAQNKNCVVLNAIHERIRDGIDWSRKGEEGLPAMTPTKLLGKIGIDRPTNTQCKEAASFLRENFGDPKRINGSYVWRIPLLPDSAGFEVVPSTKVSVKSLPVLPPRRSDDDF